MTDLLHQRLGGELIPASDRPALVDYAERIIGELPDGCASCPAAFACAVALNEDSGYGFPRTPRDVRDMRIQRGESSYSTLSGQAQFALKSIVSNANDRQEAGGTAGDRCCLDPDTPIDVDSIDY